jgi:hypothetical protein
MGSGVEKAIEKAVKSALNATLPSLSSPYSFMVCRSYTISI